MFYHFICVPKHLLYSCFSTSTRFFSTSLAKVLGNHHGVDQRTIWRVLGKPAPPKTSTDSLFLTVRTPTGRPGWGTIGKTQHFTGPWRCDSVTSAFSIYSTDPSGVNRRENPCWCFCSRKPLLDTGYPGSAPRSPPPASVTPTMSSPLAPIMLGVH